MTHSPGGNAYFAGEEKKPGRQSRAPGNSGRFRPRGTARVRRKKALTFTLTCGKRGHQAGSGTCGKHGHRAGSGTCGKRGHRAGSGQTGARQPGGTHGTCTAGRWPGPYEARTSCERKRIGTPYQPGVPISPCEMFLSFALLCQCSSCERWLAARHQELIIAGSRCECIILALEPHKLGFQVSHSLLESAHL